MFKNAREVVRVLGFKIRIDPSWFIIAALIVWSLSSAYYPGVLPGLSRNGLIIISIVSMLGLFVSLVLHELAHSVVARQFGLNVGSITLFIFGGVAELERDPESAKSEFWIAIAGPVMSMFLGGVFLLLAALANSAGSQEVLTEVLSYLGTINMMLAIFNLIPAFPLDGGRIFRSLLWHIKGDVLTATKIASRVGTFFGIALVVLGVLAIFASQIVIGMWQLLIGFFIIRVSQTSFEDLVIRHTLKNFSVSALMTRNPWVVEADETLKSVVENVMLKHNVSFIPVLDNGQLLGYVDAAMIQTIDRDNWSETRAGDIFMAADGGNTTRAEAGTEAVFDKMVRTGNRKLLIVHDGELEGVISLSDLMSFLSIRQGLGLKPGASGLKHPSTTAHA